jgi:NAD kinase
VTPICAHSLGIRPIVFGEDSHIRILNFYRNNSSVFINADGRDIAGIEEGDVINIRKSSEVFRLIRLRPYGFLSVLDRKLSGRS